MPTRPMVSALWVPAIVQVLRQAGWSDGRIARKLGLRRDQLGVERRIPLEKYCALLDLAAEATDDDHFGLRFGATRAFDNASVLGYITAQLAEHRGGDQECGALRAGARRRRASFPWSTPAPRPVWSTV